MLLVALLREQDADGRRLWDRAQAMLLDLAAKLGAAEAHRFVLDRVTDELVAFEVRCAAGDVDGAVFALRSWIRRNGGGSP